MAQVVKNAWYYRRWLIFSSFVFACTELAWLTKFGTNGALHLMIAEGCFWIIAADILIYVTGASADDLISLRLGSRKERRAEDKKE